MTHPTTEPIHSVRERLALALHRKIDSANDFYARYKSGCPNCLRYVDIFLAEIHEPSEGMIDAALVRMNAKGVVCEDDEIRHYQHIYGAMIQHIRSGGK